MSDDKILQVDEEAILHAWEVSKRARNVDTKVGCVVLNKDQKTVGVGFNRVVLPMTSIDEIANHQIKRRFVIHAEIVAITSSSPGALTAYCTLAPCFDCLKFLYFSGIRRVVYDECLASNKVFTEENLQMFSILLKETAISVRSRKGIPFLDDIQAGGYICKK